jgi:hypothetical protein
MHLSDWQLNHELPQPPRLADKAPCLFQRVRYLDSLLVCGKDKASRRLPSATRCRLLNHQPHSSTFFGRFEIRSIISSLWPRMQFLHLHRLSLGPTSASSNAIYNLYHRFFMSAERSQLRHCQYYGQNCSPLLLNAGLESTCTTDSYREVQPCGEQPPPCEEGPLVLYQVSWPLYKLAMQ